MRMVGLELFCHRDDRNIMRKSSFTEIQTVLILKVVEASTKIATLCTEQSISHVRYSWWKGITAAWKREI